MPYLLSHVKAEVHCDVIRYRWQACAKGWDLELAIHIEGLLHDFLRCVDDTPIIGPLLCGQVRMCLSVFKHLLTRVSLYCPSSVY